MTIPYPPDPNQPPPGYQAPPPVAPIRGMGTGKLLLIIGASLIGLCCVGGIVVAAVNGGKTTTSNSSSNGGSNDGGGAAKAEAGHAKLGQPARDGKFEFTVQKVDCGKSSVGDQFLNRAAQGQFCLITVAVHNIGNEARTFTGGNQKATGAGGVKYANDGAAELYANKDSQTFLENINPGNSVTGVLVFDIPKDGRITSLELHDSPFSGGVTVDVA